MRLMYDESAVSFEQDLSEDSKKKYILRGIFSSPGKKNKNGRIYPMEIWEREVEKFQEVLKSGHTNTLMELNHPARSEVDMMEAVAKMNKLWIEDGVVMGEAVLLDNPKANQLKTLIDNGIKMSVSSRGVGSLKGELVENFKLITFDIIPNLGQSDYNAEMFGIVEGILQDKEFLITESGEIREVKDNKDINNLNTDITLTEINDIKEPKELTEREKEILNKEFLSKFTSILEGLKSRDKDEILLTDFEKSKKEINENLNINEAVKITSKMASLVYLDMLLKKEKDVKNQEVLKAIMEFLSKEFKIPLGDK